MLSEFHGVKELSALCPKQLTDNDTLCLTGRWYSTAGKIDWVERRNALGEKA